MTRKEVEYEQLPDYAVTYADNIILQVGEYNAKLIFYQEVTKVNDMSDDIEKNKKHKRLKFELRIPRPTLEKLSTIALALIQARKQALKETEGKDDSGVRRAWYELDNILESAVYDTENIALSSEDITKLLEASTNLAMRISTEAKGDLNSADQ